MAKFFVMLFVALAFAACGRQQPAATPGLRKISAADQQTVERLRQSGVKILVQQPDYLIVYSDSATIRLMDAEGMKTLPAAEKELVQRLVRIHFADKTQLQKIVDLGVDVWEVQGDSVTARVYDLHLDRLKQEGFSYRILKTNASAPEER
jgi:predicted small lipoprotein YifL